ncbi:recombinase family protein [Photorhabdus thracensis]|uniref:recombinase family protein n=1 Tax=Photorhabdus thracensis TaxID=230089 RepID=UPI001E4C4F33|nr:recombinase family protein [Photorhabdus thracensis]MCC8422651.1 recombinase family protein [Photorhabdus thracensis]
MTKIGYIRVSINNQDSDLQRNTLIRVNYERTFEDKISEKTTNKQGLKTALTKRSQ